MKWSQFFGLLTGMVCIMALLVVHPAAQILLTIFAGIHFIVSLICFFVDV